MSSRRAVILTIVLSAVAMIVAACGDTVANDPKVTLAGAIGDFLERENAGLSFSMAAPGYDPEAAAGLDDMDADDAAVLAAVLDEMAFEYRWKRVDPDLPPADALLETATDAAFLHDGTALLRFRVVDSRVFVAVDFYRLADLFDAYGDGDARESIEMFSLLAVNLFDQEFVDHVVAGGWVEFIDLLDGMDVDDLEDLGDPEAPEALGDVLGAFAEDHVTVEADPDDADRLRVSTTLGALEDLMAELASESSATTDPEGEFDGPGGGLAVPDLEELGDVPPELRDVEVWMYVVLDEGELDAMLLPIGDLALHIGESADLDAEEQAEFDRQAAAARSAGLDRLELRVDVIDVTEPVDAPSDVRELRLEEVLEHMFAPFEEANALSGT